MRDGFLVGLALDPLQGSPCSGCVQLWLSERKIMLEEAGVTDLRYHKTILADLFSENSPHVIYEVPEGGIPIRLECAIFPHPLCLCRKSNYLGPQTLTKHTNFAFSPIVQLKCVRYGTPEGNLWQAWASGRAFHSASFVTAYGMGREKEAARLSAVEEWMKKCSQLPVEEETIATLSDFVSEKGEDVSTSVLNGALSALGAGATKEDATLNALHQLAKLKTLRQFSLENRYPMLIVGANSWLRQKVPFFLLQAYDLYPLFYPNSMPSWVVGLVAFSRIRTDERPVFVFAADSEISKALDMAIFRVLEHCFPGGSRLMGKEGNRSVKFSKLNLWWTHWVYRCPKLCLKDVIHLESHPRSLELWRNMAAHDQEQLCLSSANNERFPTSLRYLVQIYQPSISKVSKQNVNGIGASVMYSGLTQ